MTNLDSFILLVRTRAKHARQTSKQATFLLQYHAMTKDSEFQAIDALCNETNLFRSLGASLASDGLFLGCSSSLVLGLDVRDSDSRLCSSRCGLGSSSRGGSGGVDGSYWGYINGLLLIIGLECLMIKTPCQ